jgi:IMP dehydrogenase
MKIYSKTELNIFNQSLTYDDISLIPTQVSRIKSRTEASTNCSFLGLKLNVPVISSPMDSVTGIEMARELSNSGSLGIINRFDSSLDAVLNVKNGKGIKALSIALNTDLKTIEKIAAKKYIICIDTANANNKEVLKKTEMIKKRFDVKIIVGNIAHGGTLDELENAGADAVRVGIGGGSVCTTSIQTGIGIGQVSSLLNIYFSRNEKKLKIKIIADGELKVRAMLQKQLLLVLMLLCLEECFPVQEKLLAKL